MAGIDRAHPCARAERIFICRISVWPKGNLNGSLRCDSKNELNAGPNGSATSFAKAGLSAEMVADFAAYEARDLLEAGAPNERLEDYEHADPSFMAVSASIRYWQKFHPEAVAR